MSGQASVRPEEHLHSKCRTLGDARLRRGRAELAGSVLRVAGWLGLRRVAFTIDLRDVEGLERTARGGSPALVVRTVDGTVRSLGVTAPGLWLRAVRRSLPAGHPLAAGAAATTGGDRGSEGRQEPVLRPAEPAPPRLPRRVGSTVRPTVPFALRVAYTAADRVPAPSGPRLTWCSLDELTAS